MERDPRDLLQAAAPEIDSDPDLVTIERRARRRRAGRLLVVAAVVAAGTVAVVGVGFGLAGPDDARPVISEVPPSPPPDPPPPEPSDDTEVTTTDDEPTPSVEPSQTDVEARRDGVVPELAALPFELRVDVDRVVVGPEAQVRVEAEEGVWVVSRPDPSLIAPDGPTVGDTSGLYGRDFIDLTTYGELLLLDAGEQRILRAYPFPELAPQALVMDDGAVFCTRQGDGGVPDSMLCRVDRDTLDPMVRVFPWSGASLYLDPAQIHVPDHWSVAVPSQESRFGELRLLDGHLVAIGEAGQVRIDRQTLEPLDEHDATTQGDEADAPDDADPTAVTSEDEQLVTAFLRFAADPSEANLDGLALADEVALGLGSELHASRTAAELADADGWWLDVDDFRASAGPFSALEVARGAGATEISVGDYDRCVAPPTQAPDPVRELRRVSVQAQLGPQDSCLQWWSVDLYLDDSRVVAVSLDLYEP